MKIANEMNKQPDDIIDLDIGGTKFISTSKQTLTKVNNNLYKK